MNSDVALFWVQEAIKTAIMVIGPLLGTALVVGLIVSLFQAITSIQEMTLAFIPKIGEDKILSFLRMMVDKRLMFEENGRYLSLAVSLQKKKSFR